MALGFLQNPVQSSLPSKRWPLQASLVICLAVSHSVSLSDLLLKPFPSIYMEYMYYTHIYMYDVYKYTCIQTSVFKRFKICFSPVFSFEMSPLKNMAMFCEIYLARNKGKCIKVLSKGSINANKKELVSAYRI